MKKPLLERFQQLAGIKPLYEITEMTEGHCYGEDGKPMPEAHCMEENVNEGACYGEDGKPMPEAHCMEENIDEQIDPGTAIAAVSGMLGMISAAGGLAAINIAMENPETREKHPKLAAFLDLLDGLGKGASAAKRGGTTAGGVNEETTYFDQMSDEEKLDFQKGMDHVEFGPDGHPVSDKTSTDAADAIDPDGDGEIDDNDLSKIEDALEDIF